MIRKTLGGDRLGSGKKMQVELHGYERSTHDLGYVWRSTMSSGTLVPFMCNIILPGDTFDINLNVDVKTHPTIGPLFGSYKIQLDVFIAPIRLYQGQLHNNKLNIGMRMADVKLPLIELPASNPPLATTTDFDNSQINPSCILPYLGIRGVGRNHDDFINVKRQFNGVPLLTYWDIYKNYYANKQEEIGAVIHTPQLAIVSTVQEINVDGVVIAEDPDTGNTPIANGQTITIEWNSLDQVPHLDQIMFHFPDGNIISAQQFVQDWVRGPLVDPYSWIGTVPITPYTSIVKWSYSTGNQPFNTAPQVRTFFLSQIDLMREEVLAHTTTTPFIVNTPNLQPYSFVLGSTAGRPHMLSTQEGLGLKTYQSDLFNNWLSTEWIDGTDGITEITAIDTSGGSFTIDQLNLSKKVYMMLNRIAVSGGSYNDWLEAVWTHDRLRLIESPLYLGGLIKELVFQEVVSNSASETGQPLGTLAGKGVMAGKHKGGTVIAKCDEPSVLIGIISLTPRIDYSQGNAWHVHLLTMDDFHKPALDEIGFQELQTEQMAWWDTFKDAAGVWQTFSAGKQPAWVNYMTDVNKTYGNFAIDGNEMFMTLNRRYQIDRVSGRIDDLTTYIDPSKFNHIFAETALDAQNFWAQIGVDITARRKMSGKLMPNL